MLKPVNRFRGALLEAAADPLLAIADDDQTAYNRTHPPPLTTHVTRACVVAELVKCRLPPYDKPISSRIHPICLV